MCWREQPFEQTKKKNVEKNVKNEKNKGKEEGFDEEWTGDSKSRKDISLDNLFWEIWKEKGYKFPENKRR